MPTEAVVRSFGILPSLSLSGTVGSPLVRYASRPATRCSNVGAGVVACAAGVAEALGDGEPEGEAALVAVKTPGGPGAVIVPPDRRTPAGRHGGSSLSGRGVAPLGFDPASLAS